MDVTDTIKNRLSRANSQIFSGLVMMRNFKASKIQSDEREFEEFCQAFAAICNGLDVLEGVKDECIEKIEQRKEKAEI